MYLCLYCLFPIYIADGLSAYILAAYQKRSREYAPEIKLSFGVDFV